MRHEYICLYVILSSIAFAYSHSLCAQTRDIRTESEYHGISGHLKSKSEYYFDFWSEQEILHGRHSEWSESGRLLKDCFYYDGRLHGRYVVYYYKGFSKAINYWHHGVKQGRDSLFRRRGTLKKVKTYHAGKQQGNEFRFRRNGSVKRQQKFHQGQPHGLLRVYGKKKGKIKREQYYKKGKRLKTSSDKEPVLPKGDKKGVNIKKKKTKPIRPQKHKNKK